MSKFNYIKERFFMKGNKIFFERARNSLSFKIFIFFSAFIIMISSGFIWFSAYHDLRAANEDLIKSGETLSGFLAYSTRTWVFAENREMLSDSVQGIMNQKNVLAVAIYNADHKLLFSEIKGPLKKGQKLGDEGAGLAAMPGDKRVLITEGKDTVEFLSPVVLESYLHSEEALYFANIPSAGRKNVIGYVKVVLDKTILRKEIRTIVFKSIGIAISFLFLGALVIYVTFKKVLRPLIRLTKAVDLFGKGEFIEKVPVESSDEIGKLAMAFNSMTDNLKGRDAENRLLEEQLRHSQKMETVGTLTGGIAHDFNNILTTIMNCGNILELKMGKNEPLRTYVSQILAASERAANLTNGLLSFSRKQIIKPRPVRLNDIVIKVEKLLHLIIGENIKLKTMLAGEDLTVIADSGQIEQVLINLCTNARDAMPEGGKLTIKTELAELDPEFRKTHSYGKPGLYAVVSVTDTGAGMDEKTRERIFEPFFTTKDVGKGTGLGLSIAYGIIRQHNGYINCESETGKGTTFRAYLPLTESLCEETGSAAGIAMLRGSETVLVAEDDSDVREVTRDILEEFGYKVIEATDGEDAVNKFIENEDRIGFLLFDVKMPKKNGKEAFDEIKKIRPDIKALLLSGYADDVIDKERLHEDGINLMTKPVPPAELLQKIRELLDR
ncbi:MAG: integral membrane sensor hybrid histidine kinase [Nitrospirae bacterium]|nr:MAG: integral membrane sensor hybrid histidine kinase [Nitrospirota bacterium]